jgi:hypothetical protein
VKYRGGGGRCIEKLLISAHRRGHTKQQHETRCLSCPLAISGKFELVSQPKDTFLAWSYFDTSLDLKILKRLKSRYKNSYSYIEIFFVVDEILKYLELKMFWLQCMAANIGNCIQGTRDPPITPPTKLNNETEDVVEKRAN